MEKPEHTPTAMLPMGGHSVALDHLHSWPAAISGGHRMAGGPDSWSLLHLSPVPGQLGPSPDSAQSQAITPLTLPRARRGSPRKSARSCPFNSFLVPLELIPLPPAQCQPGGIQHQSEQVPLLQHSWQPQLQQLSSQQLKPPAPLASGPGHERRSAGWMGWGSTSDTCSRGTPCTCCSSFLLSTLLYL